MKATFQLITLGCSGGPWENNLSSYLLAPANDDRFIVFDGGSILSGIDAALKKSQFENISFKDKSIINAGEFFTKHIKAYLISHAHLDHICGLVLNSQMDIPKYILGIDPTIDNIRNHIFNSRIWPNYGNEGSDPIGIYTYIRLSPEELFPIPDTSMNVRAFHLHHPRLYPSTAFLVEYEDNFIIYFGDTSSDKIEKEKPLEKIWKHIAPLIHKKKLRGILLECSYSHAESEQTKFGHLDTKLMMREMHNLHKVTQTSLEGLNVVVTHRKDNFQREKSMPQTIAEELTKMNDLGLKLHFPCQGDKILL